MCRKDIKNYQHRGNDTNSKWMRTSRFAKLKYKKECDISFVPNEKTQKNPCIMYNQSEDTEQIRKF